MTTISDESHNLKGSSVSECEPDSPLSRDSGFDNLSNDSDRREDSSIIHQPVMKSETSTKMQTTSSKLYENLDGVSETERLDSLQSILKMFFDNRINEAERLVEKHETSCVNHSHVKMFFSTMSAMLTLDPELMENAKKQVQKHMDFCEKRRPKRANFASRLFFQEDYNSYTDMEMLTELNYAESLFLYAILTFFNGQTIMTLIRAAFKLNSSYNMLHFCYEVHKHKNNWQEEHVKYTFDAGVLNAIGFINLCLSNLPNSILKLMAIAGLTGERELGIKCVTECFAMPGHIRQQLSYCMMLGYNIYLEQMLGLGEGGTDWAEEVASKFLQIHPNGAIPLFLNARVSLLRSDPKRALELYHRCLDLHSDWKQIDLFCYFDLIWSYAVIQDWKNAAKYSLVLKENCTWGQAINEHQWASFMYMENEKTQDPEIADQIAKAMELVPKLRVRYAGRTFPMEKFALQRADKFFTQQQTCLVPAYELFHVWSIFPMLKRDQKLLQPIADRLDSELQNFDPQIRDFEDKCVLLFLRGVCARFQKQYDLSIECLTEVSRQENEPCLRKSYVVPHAMLELGLVFKEMGDLKQARQWIEKARSGRSTKYLLEALVQLKAHGAIREINARKKE